MKVGVAEYGPRSPEELLAFLRGHLEPSGLTSGFGGRIALVDRMVHHQDIRRPLGRPREIPAERLRPRPTRAGRADRRLSGSAVRSRLPG